MALKRNKKNHYDVTFIGSNLSQLFMAYHLRKTGLKVAIITEDDKLGGSSRLIQYKGHFFDQCVQFSPFHEDGFQNISELFTNWCEELHHSESEMIWQTYDSGKTQEFVGFGNEKPESFDALESTLAQKVYNNYNYSPGQWAHRFENVDLGDIYTLQMVTKLEVEDGQISSFILNGAKNYTTTAVVYGNSLKEIKRLFHHDDLGSKLISKFAKIPAWAAVHMFLVHDSLPEKLDYSYLLKGSKTEPCLGRFFQEQREDQVFNISRWVSYIPYDLADDDETAGQALRDIKKQIKRAFPELHEGIQFERIYLEPNALSFVEKLVSGYKINKINNLWVCGPGMSPAGGLLAEFIQGQDLLLQVSQFLSEELAGDEGAAKPVEELSQLASQQV